MTTWNNNNNKRFNISNSSLHYIVATYSFWTDISGPNTWHYLELRKAVRIEIVIQSIKYKRGYVVRIEWNFSKWKQRHRILAIVVLALIVAADSRRSGGMPLINAKEKNDLNSHIDEEILEADLMNRIFKEGTLLKLYSMSINWNLLQELWNFILSFNINVYQLLG